MTHLTLEEKLHRWVAWNLHHCQANLGYPSTSPYHISRWVRTPKQQSQIPRIEEDPEAEQMERYLMQLHHHQSTWARVLLIDCLEIGTQKSKACKAQLSYSHYRDCLKRGKAWLQLKLQLQ